MSVVDNTQVSISFVLFQCTLHEIKLPLSQEFFSKPLQPIDCSGKAQDQDDANAQDVVDGALRR